MNLRSFFHSGQIVYQTSAPGRLDVMGGIADYSGSLVLQMPIQERAKAWVRLRKDGKIRVYSASVQALGDTPVINLSLHSLLKRNGSVDYEFARKKMAAVPGGQWAAYAIGCILVLLKEKAAVIRGADIYLESQVPIGKGVSSSAAIEVAVMAALAKACSLSMKPHELPLLAQRVENHVVGAPCGIMDQMASYLGKKNQLLPIVCQPAETFPTVKIPEPVHFIGIDSGVRHSVSGASYGDVRTAAFMGYSIIAQSQGADVQSLQEAKTTGDLSNLPFKGYLANIDVSHFESHFERLLPRRMTGQAFLTRYKETMDSVTSIDPSKTYAVRVCTAHPVYENERVYRFRRFLETTRLQQTGTPQQKKMFRMLGDLMYESHSSYSACGLGSEATDALVRAVCEAGIRKGVYGAKITGGGSGGSVCVLSVGQKGFDTVQTIAQRHADRYNFDPVLFLGSSAGARYVGVKKRIIQ